MRFLEISLGSCFEVETQLLIAAVANFGDEEIRHVLLKEIDEEQKMLIAFMKKLNTWQLLEIIGLMAQSS